MKYLITAVALLALAVTAFAGGNPNAKAYISFDQTGDGGQVHTYTMLPYTPFDAYVCLTDLDMGMKVVSFMLNDLHTENPGAFLVAPSFTNLLPGDLAIGNVYTGITISATSCQTQDPVVVCSVSYVPTGPAGLCLQLHDHPDYPRWVVDCLEPNGEVDYYTLIAEGQGDIGEGCESPVEEDSWGAIKSLYR